MLCHVKEICMDENMKLPAVTIKLEDKLNLIRIKGFCMRKCGTDNIENRKCSKGYGAFFTIYVFIDYSTKLEIHFDRYL